MEGLKYLCQISVKIMAFVNSSFKEKIICTFNQYKYKLNLVAFIYYYHKTCIKLWNYFCYKRMFKSFLKSLKNQKLCFQI